MIRYNMNAVQEFFVQWKDEGVVNLIDVLSDLIILTASRTLLGRPPTTEIFPEFAGKPPMDLLMGLQGRE